MSQSRTIRLLTDASKPDNNDHHLIEVRFKEHSTTSKKPMPTWWPNSKKPPNYCVSVQKFNIQVQPAALADAMCEHFYGLQEQRVREIIEERITAAKSTVFNFDLDEALLEPEAIAIWYSATATSGRLSADRIGSWFAANSDSISVQLTQDWLAAGKSEQEISSSLLPRVTAGLAGAFLGFATPGFKLDTASASKYRKLVAAANPTDETTIKLLSRLDSFIRAADKFDLSDIA